MSEERNSARTGASVAGQIKAATRRPRDQVTLARDDAHDDNEFRQMAEQFPTDAYDVEDPLDERMETIVRMQRDAMGMEDGARPGDTIAGKVPWDERTVKYFERKRDKQLEYTFEKWFANWFDRQNEAQKAYARKMYPNFYRRRLATLKDNVKLAHDLARIKITGIQSRKDLMLKYAADQGYIDTDGVEGALLTPDEVDGERSRDQFVRGVFNVRGWGTGRTGARTLAPDAETRQRARRINTEGFYGEAPPYGHQLQPDMDFHGRRAARTDQQGRALAATGYDF